MKGANIVTDDVLALMDVSQAEVDTATRVIAEFARTPEERLLFLAKVDPTPHTVEADPSARRAAPRHGISA